MALRFRSHTSDRGKLFWKPPIRLQVNPQLALLGGCDLDALVAEGLGLGPWAA